MDNTPVDNNDKSAEKMPYNNIIREQPVVKGGISNLVDIRSVARARGTTVQEMGRLGGQSVDPTTRSITSRLNALKKKGEMNDEDAERLYKMMTDHKYAALDVLETLKIMRDIAIKSNNIQQINLYTQRINDWNKLYHGEKVKIESTNVNVNINATLDEWDKRMARFKQENE